MKWNNLLAFALILLSIFIILISIHNIDLVFNMSSDCYDQSIAGIIQDRDIMYFNGLRGLLTSSILSVISLLLLLMDFDRFK